MCLSLLVAGSWTASHARTNTEVQMQRSTIGSTLKALFTCIMPQKWRQSCFFSPKAALTALHTAAHIINRSSCSPHIVHPLTSLCGSTVLTEHSGAFFNSWHAQNKPSKDWKCKCGPVMNPSINAWIIPCLMSSLCNVCRSLLVLILWTPECLYHSDKCNIIKASDWIRPKLCGFSSQAPSVGSYVKECYHQGCFALLLKWKRTKMTLLALKPMSVP